jgi:DNA topoisomerase IB
MHPYFFKAYVGNAGRLTHAQIARMRRLGKFERAVAMHKILPKLRLTYNRHLLLSGFPKMKAMGLAAKLMDRVYLRVGNEDSAEEGVYGLSTLKRGHVDFRGNSLHIRYVGKKQVDQHQFTTDPSIVQPMREMMAVKENADDSLFVYRDRYGQARPVTAKMLRHYLGWFGIVPKDFRTYHANRLFVQHIKGRRRTDANIQETLEWVAARLGNTPAVCKRAYVDPRLTQPRV